MADETELALRRKRRFGLVENVQATRYEAGSEQLEKALAVRVRVEVHSIALLERSERLCRRTARKAARPRRPISILHVDLRQSGLHLRTQPCDVLREPEEVLGPQEEALVRAPRPCKSETIGERSLGRERSVIPNGLAAYGWQADGRRNSLQQGRLAGPVLANEERHGGRKLERLQRAHDGHRERESAWRFSQGPLGFDRTKKRHASVSRRRCVFGGSDLHSGTHHCLPRAWSTREANIDPFTTHRNRGAADGDARAPGRGADSSGVHGATRVWLPDAPSLRRTGTGSRH